jgi:N-acetylneuraminic acid mutarotase
MNSLFMHLLLALALLAGCSPSSSSTGGAQLAVSLPQGLSASISRVSVTASAADFPPVSVDLVFSNGTWGGTLGNLPAGSNRTFLAQAFDASGTQRFEGSVTGVSISAEQTTLVAITLQQLDAPPPFENEAPIIDSLTAPSTSVAVGSALSLVAAAHDPNPGDTLTYAWSSTAGAFSSASTDSTSWTAPSTPGFQTLTLTVTDSQGLASSLALNVYVTPAAMRGHVGFSITFNISPQVTSLSAAPTRLEVGEATSVSALASDVEGDSLTYAWSASCAGSWSNASSSSAQFTPSAVPAGSCNNCRLTVAVTDGRGGQTTGTVSLCVSNASTHRRNPVILTASGSSGTAAPGQVLTFEVEGLDPESSALSFSWSANTGVLGAPVHTASSSRISWTAPSCVQASTTSHITATVTNAFNRSVPQDFTVTGLPTCGWAWTGSMISPRAGHTATLLNTGKVLVTGGTSNGSLLATAELYDPATGTWSTTGSMASPRENHSATLLNDGKVLVTGGDGTSDSLAEAEVYDPATGTWSTTGPMVSPRTRHTATRLSTGRVLVTGGIAQGYTAATAEVYDPATGTWSTTGSMASPHNGHTMTLLNTGKVLVTGGQGDDGIVATGELYDPDAGTWSATGSMVSPRFAHTATLLSSGKVLVTGGYSEDYLDTVEVYDPSSGTWSAAASMRTPHAWHTATLLNNGQILVGGGLRMNPGEVYSPGSDTWSEQGSGFPTRSGHTATLLASGQVLIAGGYEFGPVATAKLYVP